MRLLVANANTTEAITALCAETARAAASPGTEIVPATPRFGPAVIATRAEDAIAGHALLSLLAEHAGPGDGPEDDPGNGSRDSPRDGAGNGPGDDPRGSTVDAVLLAVSLDTALEAARQLMPCPVVGMTEAACLTACLLGGRFGLVTLGGVEAYRERIARHGLAARLARLRGVDATPQEAVRDPDGLAQRLLAEVEALAREGADAVVLGGAALAGMAPRLQPRAPVPLLDGIACGVRLAEALVALRLPKPLRGSFARPEGRASLGLDAPLAALLRGG